MRQNCFTVMWLKKIWDQTGWRKYNCIVHVNAHCSHFLVIQFLFQFEVHGNRLFWHLFYTLCIYKEVAAPSWNLATILFTLEREMSSFQGFHCYPAVSFNLFFGISKNNSREPPKHFINFQCRKSVNDQAHKTWYAKNGDCLESVWHHLAFHKDSW